MKRATAKALTVATSLAVAGAVAGSGALTSNLVASPAVEAAAYTVTPTTFHTATSLAAGTADRSTFAERASRDAATREARAATLAAAKAAKAKAAKTKALKAKRAVAKAKAAAKARIAKKKRAATLTTRPVTAGTARALGKKMAAKRGWTGSQWAALDRLWNAESGWSVTAGNGSGAYGIPQALPGSKMSSAGSDWRTSAATQIEWGLNYIDSRWGSPMNAWNHFQSSHWY